MCVKGLLRLLTFCVVFLGICVNSKNEADPGTHVEISDKELEKHKYKLDQYYEKRKDWKTSNVGAVLFKRKNPEDLKIKSTVKKGSNYLIYTWNWNHWRNLEYRFVYNFESDKAYNFSAGKVFDGCIVKNCILTHHAEDFNKADAVVVHVQRGKFPKVKFRNLKQRWIFFSEDSPLHTFKSDVSEWPNIADFADMFNWTMTYRTNSDIPVPAGRTVPLAKPVAVNTSDYKDALSRLVPYWKDKTARKAMVIYTDCEKSKTQFIATIRKHIGVDIFGNCTDEKGQDFICPNRVDWDCIVPVQTNYYFYLVLETTSCHQYLSESVFHHAYSKGAIPVLMAPSLEDCETLLPPKSFLHLDHYKSVSELAKHMKEISNYRRKVLAYHSWRKHFTVINEHGFFKTKSYHLCRVCEALNYNDRKVKVYSENALQLFLNEKKLCNHVKLGVKNAEVYH